VAEQTNSGSRRARAEGGEKRKKVKFGLGKKRETRGWWGIRKETTRGHLKKKKKHINFSEGCAAEWGKQRGGGCGCNLMNFQHKNDRIKDKKESNKKGEKEIGIIPKRDGGVLIKKKGHGPKGSYKLTHRWSKGQGEQFGDEAEIREARSGTKRIWWGTAKQKKTQGLPAKKRAECEKGVRWGQASREKNRECHREQGPE